ncbi:LOW QUALITY PROTEIN: hypothetical protein V1478_016974 [Vespula squamosa]|uniref:Uncharacterized protein n=1 Tax=Vespula squamosa TaxID=30214 RepID=A0ABD1ZY37_VESSQ
MKRNDRTRTCLSIQNRSMKSMQTHEWSHPTNDQTGLRDTPDGEDVVVYEFFFFASTEDEEESRDGCHELEQDNQHQPHAPTPKSFRSLEILRIGVWCLKRKRIKQRRKRKEKVEEEEEEKEESIKGLEVSSNPGRSKDFTVTPELNF